MMQRSLSAQEVLRIWELGARQHPVEQAMTIIAIACAELSREARWALSIGQRDALLLEIRATTFGSRSTSFAHCPACQESLEFELAIADMQVIAADAALAVLPEPPTLALAAYSVQVRLLDSLDLLTIVGCHDLATARQQLVQRCVVAATYDGEAVAVDALPEALIVAIAEHVAQSDPQAELLLDLSCPACGHQWSTLFDIAAFLWTEICASARRLLREVHLLARAYGWREADILAMSAVRRQQYLEMVPS